MGETRSMGCGGQLVSRFRLEHPLRGGSILSDSIQRVLHLVFARACIAVAAYTNFIVAGRKIREMELAFAIRYSVSANRLGSCVFCGDLNIRYVNLDARRKRRAAPYG
jgi:hypothetical protein